MLTRAARIVAPNSLQVTLATILEAQNHLKSTSLEIFEALTTLLTIKYDMPSI